MLAVSQAEAPAALVARHGRVVGAIRILAGPSARLGGGVHGRRSSRDNRRVRTARRTGDGHTANATRNCNGRGRKVRQPSNAGWSYSRAEGLSGARTGCGRSVVGPVGSGRVGG